MKVFILTTVMAPYRVQLFSEIGKQCELYVCFEQMRSSERDEKWYDESSTNFHLVKLKRWDASVKTAKPDVIKHIRNIRPDIVIAYEYHTNTSLLMLSYCQLMRIPYIINCDGAFLSKSIKDVVKKHYISRARGFISSGTMADKYLLHYGASESRIHFNHFTSLHTADILKNVPSVEERNILVRFNIVGDGRNKESLIRRIKENSVEKYFNLTSWQPAEKIPCILFASDAAFLSFADNPIYSMTIPAKLQSYMACGIPILASICGEAKRVLEEADCGYVCEIGRSEALAETIESFLSISSERKNEMKRNAVAYCKKHFDKKIARSNYS